jgi:hypothetical protein
MNLTLPSKSLPTGALPRQPLLPQRNAASDARQPGTEPRPLMPLSAVMTCLDLDEDDCLVLIDEGALIWAFDIRGPGSQKRQVRVLTESVEDLVQRRKRNWEDDESEWQRVAALIFPDKPAIVTCELARALNCGRAFTMDLIHARQFQFAPGGARIRQGPNGSPQITTASAKRWLLKRRML